MSTTIENAPRDAEGLMRLSVGVHYKLASSLGLFGLNDTEHSAEHEEKAIAFCGQENLQRAEELARALKDQDTGKPVAETTAKENPRPVTAAPPQPEIKPVPPISREEEAPCETAPKRNRTKKEKANGTSTKVEPNIPTMDDMPRPAPLNTPINVAVPPLRTAPIVDANSVTVSSADLQKLIQRIELLEGEVTKNTVLQELAIAATITSIVDNKGADSFSKAIKVVRDQYDLGNHIIPLCLSAAFGEDLALASKSLVAPPPKDLEFIETALRRKRTKKARKLKRGK